jgi:hypothetical protein
LTRRGVPWTVGRVMSLAKSDDMYDPVATWYVKPWAQKKKKQV